MLKRKPHLRARINLNFVMEQTATSHRLSTVLVRTLSGAAGHVEDLPRFTASQTPLTDAAVYRMV